MGGRNFFETIRVAADACCALVAQARQPWQRRVHQLEPTTAMDERPSRVSSTVRARDDALHARRVHGAR